MQKEDYQFINNVMQKNGYGFYYIDYLNHRIQSVYRPYKGQPPAFPNQSMKVVCESSQAMFGGTTPIAQQPGTEIEFSKEATELLIKSLSQVGLDAQKRIISFIKKSSHPKHYFPFLAEHKELLNHYLNTVEAPKRRQGLKDDFDAYFPVLKKLSFKEPPDVQALIVFSKYYKNIIRRADYKSTFCSFIASSVPATFHQKFEPIVKREIITQELVDFVEEKHGLTLNINQENILARYSSSMAEQQGNMRYWLNSQHKVVANFFNLKKTRQKLDIESATYIPFLHSKKHAAMLFTLNSLEHQGDIEPLYKELIKAAITIANNNPKERVAPVALNPVLEEYFLNKLLTRKDEAATPQKKNKL